MILIRKDFPEHWKEEEACVTPCYLPKECENCLTQHHDYKQKVQKPFRFVEKSNFTISLCVKFTRYINR